MSLDESSFGGLKVFFWVEVVRVLLDIKSLSLLAEVYTLLELMLGDVHLGDDSLNAYEFIC